MFSCFKKPGKPRPRKFHSMHGRTKMNKVVQQRKPSLQEKVEEKLIIEVDGSGSIGGTNRVDGVDHPAVVQSRSPSQDLEGKASPVNSSVPVENGE